MARDQIRSLIGYNILGGEYEKFDIIIDRLTTEQIRQYTTEPDVEKIKMIDEE